LEDSSTLSNTHSLITPVPSEIITQSLKKIFSGNHRQTPIS